MNVHIQTKIQKRAFFIFVLSACLLVGVMGVGPSAVPVTAQEARQLTITNIDTSQFPTVSLEVLETDLLGYHVTSASDLQLHENDSLIGERNISVTPTGIDLIFVIDANFSILTIDEEGGVARLEKIKEAIAGYAEEFMDADELDRVSIVVPDGRTGGMLLEDATQPNQVINAINFYDPGYPGYAPLNETMTVALAHAADIYESGRFQAMVLFSDGALIAQPLDFETLVNSANELNLSIYPLILGQRDDPQEIENMGQLYGPTNGYYLHMGTASVADILYRSLGRHDGHLKISYTSTLNEVGAHTLTVTHNQTSDRRPFSLTVADLPTTPVPTATVVPQISVENLDTAVEPMSMDLILTSGRSALRTGGPNILTTPLSKTVQLVPTSNFTTVSVLASGAWVSISQTISIHIYQPDDLERKITMFQLLVNENMTGSVTLSESALDELNNKGTTSLAWPLDTIPNGTQEFQILVTDTVKLDSLNGSNVALSDGTLKLDTGSLSPIWRLRVRGTGAAPFQPPSLNTFRAVEGRNLIIAGSLAMALALILILLLRYQQRRRLTGSAQGEEMMENDDTMLIVPDFIIHRSSRAYLEPLAYAIEHQNNIPITEHNMALGRDPDLAQIIFQDESVSRLHAHIIESNGGYRISDESSTSGTYVNRERIGLAPQVLQQNDEIHLGRVHLRFHLTSVIDGDSGLEEYIDDEASTQDFVPTQTPF